MYSSTSGRLKGLRPSFSRSRVFQLGQDVLVRFLGRGQTGLDQAHGQIQKVGHGPGLSRQGRQAVGDVAGGSIGRWNGPTPVGHVQQTRGDGLHALVRGFALVAAFQHHVGGIGAGKMSVQSSVCLTYGVARGKALGVVIVDVDLGHAPDRDADQGDQHGQDQLGPVMGETTRGMQPPRQEGRFFPRSGRLAEIGQNALRHEHDVGRNEQHRGGPGDHDAQGHENPENPGRWNGRGHKGQKSGGRGQGGVEERGEQTAHDLPDGLAAPLGRGVGFKKVGQDVHGVADSDGHEKNGQHGA